jgi:hypothetical protein
MERQILKFSMLIGVLSFVLAVVIGVWRIALTRGFLLPPIPEFLPPHGNIMVGAFLGTLIIFERMLALPVKWLLWVPFLWALSSLTVHLEPIMFKAINLISLIGWGIHRWIAYRTFKHLWNPLIEFIAYILLSLALMKTNGLAESPISAIAGLSFAICVIGVERIELMLGFKKFTAKLVYALLILYSIFLIFNLLVHEMAIEIIGVALIITTIGMFFNDASMMAKFGENKLKTPISALQKFSKETLTIAYIWLLLGGIFLTIWNSIPLAKDVIFHSLGLGFIFTMILSHAPIVLGSTLKKMPKKPPSRFLFYIFQAMTIARLIGDFIALVSLEFWKWSGWITGTFHFLIFILYILNVLRNLK